MNDKALKSVTIPCECEHECHFPSTDGKNWSRSPNGNPGHKYGSKHFPRGMRAIETDNGTFLVCSDCVVDCFQMEM